MPEGDTIFRIARTLNRALAGQQVVAFESVYAPLARVNDDSPLVDRIVERIEPHGKWLLIYFSGDLILATHMRMKGRWHLYRVGERWQMGHQHMRIRIQTKDFEAVAFDVSVAHFYTGESLAKQSDIPGLGPDVLGESFAVDEAVTRIRAHSQEEIADVLLNQRVIAGVGNIYKSEICFACGVNPFRLVKELSNRELDCLVEKARKLMGANVAESARGGIQSYSGPRRTTGSLEPGARLWVYRRVGRPCRRCGATIMMRKQGAHARSTYWCPECQKSSYS